MNDKINTDMRPTGAGRTTIHGIKDEEIKKTRDKPFEESSLEKESSTREIEKKIIENQPAIDVANDKGTNTSEATHILKKTSNIIEMMVLYLLPHGH